MAYLQKKWKILLLVMCYIILIRNSEKNYVYTTYFPRAKNIFSKNLIVLLKSVVVWCIFKMIQLPIFHKPSKVCLMPLDMNRSRMLLASRSTTTLHFAPSISIGVRFLHKAAKVYIHMSISTCSKQQRWKAVNGEWRGKTPMEEE